MQTLYFIVYNFFNCSSFFVKVFSLLSSFLLLFIPFFLSIPYSISPLETKPCSYVLHDSPSAALIKFTPFTAPSYYFLHGIYVDLSLTHRCPERCLFFLFFLVMTVALFMCMVSQVYGIIS